jgi:hypothetical protein
MAAPSYELVLAKVRSQVAAITDPEILAALTPLLVEPTSYFPTPSDAMPHRQIPSWLVLEDPSSDTGIVYSEPGLIPGSPWGLVWLSKRFLGDDSSWYLTLEDAFCNSWAAGSIRVWDVLRIESSGAIHMLEKDLTLDDACERLNELNAPFREDPGRAAHWSHHYTVQLRTRHRMAG